MVHVGGEQLAGVRAALAPVSVVGVRVQVAQMVLKLSCLLLLLLLLMLFAGQRVVDRLRLDYLHVDLMMRMKVAMRMEVGVVRVGLR